MANTGGLGVLYCEGAGYEVVSLNFCCHHLFLWRAVAGRIG